MGYKLLVLFILVFPEGLSALTLVPSANPVPVGTNVTISLNDSIAISFGGWLFGPAILFIWSSGVTVTGSGYSDGITFNSITYELTLSSVNLNSTGRYVLEALGVNKNKGEVYLDVQEPVSNVSLNVSKSSLVELNDSVTFTCSARGTPMWVTWQNGSSMVTAGGRVVLSTDGQVLTINGVMRYDKGPFMCIVANNISKEQSMEMNLTISYGPSNLTLAVSPDSVVYKSGTVISLSCSTDSKPSASIFWSYNDVPLNVHGSNLELNDTTQNKTGQYACIAYNAVTLRYATVTKTIRIVDPISEVVVDPQAGYPIENISFTLNCKIVGSMGSILWKKNSMYLYSNNGITLSNQNSTLSFNQLSKNDNGQYQCVASNALSNMTSLTYNLTVNYGPRNIAISGQGVTSVGSSVTFNCSADSQPQSQYSWYFKGMKVGDRPVYITDAVLVNNSGQYTCLAFNNITGRSINASMELSVIVPVSNVTINTDNQQPVFNQSFTLTCNVSGDVGTIQWMKNGVGLYSNNRTTFSGDNSTISFIPLTLNDNGQYQCAVRNPVSNMTSLAYNLTVNYGPWNTIISGPAVGAVGSNVTFNCSASSHPPSQYSWFFSGLKKQDGPVYVITALTINSRGQYTCMAFNNITRNSNNASVELTIFTPISNVTVNIGNNQQPVLNQSFTLTCNVSGDVGTIQWMKNGVRLYSNNRITFSGDNSTISFIPLTLNDNGQYQCAVRNPVSNMTSLAYNLTVNYGPWNTTISGPAVGAVGSNVTFNCSASSHPPSQYSWFFSGLKKQDGPVYVITALTINSRGQYTCMAFNNITKNSNNASVELTIFNPISNVTVNIGNNQQPVLNQSFTLTCNVSGDVGSIEWMKNGLRLYSNNWTMFSGDNSTISFIQLTFDDNGQYQCLARNPVSNMTSLAYNLTVNYGPWNTTVTGPSRAETGSNVTFSCSAISHPQSQYSWSHNGSVVAVNSIYVIEALELNNSGQYTCQAFNNITGNHNIGTLELTVYERISSVHVISSPFIPQASENLQLVCHVEGPYNSLHWQRNNETLQQSDRVKLLENNTTVNFTPLWTADNGNYQCVATNAFRTYESKRYLLVASFGPFNVQILVKPGYRTTLTCKAESQPPAVYQWTIDNAIVGNTSSIEVSIQSILNYNFTCVAKNPLTNVTVYTSHFISDPDAGVGVHASVMLTALLALLLLVLNEYL